MENKNEWRKVKLRDVVYINQNNLSKEDKWEYINYLDTANITDGIIENIKELNLEKDVIPSRAKRKILKEDIIISSVRPNLKHFGIIKNPKKNMIVSTGFIVLTAKKNIIDPFYLYNFFRKSDVIEYLSSIAETSTTTYPSITSKVIEELEIKLPSLNIQKKIAKILSDIDEKIELNNKINDNLEKQCITIFNKMFPQIFYGNFKVGTYLKPKRGKNLLVKNAIIGNIPVVAGGLEPAIYHNQSNTQSPVITISASGANAGFIRLWHIPVWSSDSSYIDFSVSKFIYFWYVFLKLRQKEIFDLQSGSAQPHIYPKHIEDLSINKLDLNLVESFNNIISSFFKKIGENNLENEKLINLKNYLLPKLMNGEINVENIEL